MRNTLLKIAQDIYAVKGSKLSLAEITAKAGVSRPTVYKHLGNKAAILSQITDSQNDDIDGYNIDERIMRGVRTIVSAQGFSAATIEAIAKSSGVGPATIYRKFKDKDNLIKSFIKSQRIGDPTPEFLDNFSNQFGEQLAFKVDHMLHFMLQNKLIISLIFSGNKEDRAYVQTLRNQSNSNFAKMVQFFQTHQDEQNITSNINATDLATNLFGMVHAHAILIPNNNTPDPDQAAFSICQMFKSIEIG